MTDARDAPSREGQPGPDDVVVAYYSRTGTTARVARTVVDALESGSGTDASERAGQGVARIDPRIEYVEPRRQRPYPNWLARSFVPGSRVAIRPVETDLRDARALFLGTPKWTLSCPPVTEFCRRVALDGTPVGLFLTYGGFDERRYARSLAASLADRGADVRATLLVQRDAVGTGNCRDRVEQFCERVLA